MTAHLSPIGATHNNSDDTALTHGGGSPYSARTTSLDLPPEGEPGTPLPCTLRLRYEGERACLDPLLSLQSANATFIGESVRIDGRPAACDRVDGGVLVKIPPLRPGDSLEVECALILPLGLEDGAHVPIEATLSAHGGTFTVRQSVLARSQPRLDASAVAFDLEGPNYLVQDEHRSLHIALHNSGTSAARDVRLEVTDLRDLDAEPLTFVGLIAAGDTRVVPLRICAHGQRPRLQLRVLHADGAADLPEFTCDVRTGPRINGQLLRDGDLPLPDAPQRFPVRIALCNVGDAPAIAPTVHLRLPQGVRLVDRSDPVVRFAKIEAGLSEERTILLDFDSAQVDRGATLEAIIDLGDEHLQLEPLPLGVAHIASIVVHDFALPALTAGERVRTTLALLSDGNSIIPEARLRLTFGDGLAYDGDLAINGLPTTDDDLRAESAITLQEIPPGTLIEVSWTTRALHATVRGTTTAITAHVGWGATIVTASTAPLRIAPGTIAAKTLADLPFRVAGVRALAESIAAAAAAEPTSSTAAPVPAPPAHDHPAPPIDVPKVQASDINAHNEPTQPVIEDTLPLLDADSLKVTRQRLALAIATNSPLGSLIIALGALADLGSHPPTESYRRAVGALRALTHVLMTGRALSKEQRATLRQALAEFAQTDPLHDVSLLAGLAAVAQEVAESERPEVWWEQVRTFGAAAQNALEQANTDAPTYDTEPIDLSALSDIRRTIAQVASAVPMSA